jgi:hypothetical protein
MDVMITRKMFDLLFKVRVNLFKVINLERKKSFHKGLILMIYFRYFLGHYFVYGGIDHVMRRWEKLSFRRFEFLRIDIDKMSFILLILDGYLSKRLSGFI